jgi:hypothetical protein
MEQMVEDGLLLSWPAGMRPIGWNYATAAQPSVPADSLA